MDMGFIDSRTPEAGDSVQELKPLGWRELCARLAAVQDLRRVLVEGSALPPVSGEASFYRPAARLLVRSAKVDRSGLPSGDSEGGVNPIPSANGKVDRRTSSGTQQRMSHRLSQAASQADRREMS